MEPIRLLLRDPWPILGMHGESPMEGGGWTVLTREHGDDPTHTGGGDFRFVLEKGRRPIVRLNVGYGERGTIPRRDRYDQGSHRAAVYVRDSKGCDVWVIGNEWNCSWERPRYPNGTRPPIMPWEYASYYDMARERIRNVPGHEMDIVLFAPVGPWNPETVYKTNERGDWLRAYQDAQAAVETDIDGFAWHAYAREQDATRLSRHHYMDQPGWTDHHWEFHVFEDWHRATLAKYQSRYRFITEFNANKPWQDINVGFIRQAVLEIFAWNQTRDAGPAAIQALATYRWEYDRWEMKGKNALLQDWQQAAYDGYMAPGADDPTVPPINPDPDPDPGGNTWSLTGRLVGPDGQQYRIEGSVIREAI